MNEELKPCPFCGGEASLYVYEGVCVICPTCGARTITERDLLTSKNVAGNATKSVIKKWNRRVRNDE